MIGWDLLRGKRFRTQELIGLVLAVSGLVTLTLPGTSAPDIGGAALMTVAGIAWGIYSLRGKGADDPLRATAGNFVLSLAFMVPLAAVGAGESHASSGGIFLAVISGALASGVGYAVWYTALRGLTSTQAALVQLLVPVLAALGGVVLLGEGATLRLFLSGGLIIAGVWLAVMGTRRR
jgi:drug/metabolite transporter (DMT)-like permease